MIGNRLAFAACFGAAALLAPSVLAKPPAPPAAVAADPPIDKAHPASMATMRIDSHGSLMNAVFYLAAGDAPHPTVLLFHGLPGNEQNLDLAQALRREGYNVMTFHYRGSWGSQGHFSLANGEEDGLAMMAFLTDPKNQASYHIDPKRLIAIGHSYGGYVTARTAAASPGVKAVVLIAPADIGFGVKSLSSAPAAALPAIAAKVFDDVDGRLGDTMSLDIAKEIIAPGHEWRLETSAAAIASRPILILTADRDSENCKAIGLSQGLADAKANAVTKIAMPTDHPFSDQRVALENAVLSWLKSHG